MTVTVYSSLSDASGEVADRFKRHCKRVYCTGTEFCKNTRVNFLGQSVSNQFVREHVRDSVSAPKAAGITHCAVRVGKEPSRKPDYKALFHGLGSWCIELLLLMLAIPNNKQRVSINT